MAKALNGKWKVIILAVYGNYNVLIQVLLTLCMLGNYTPLQTLFVVGILFSRCLSVRASVHNALFP